MSIRCPDCRGRPGASENRHTNSSESPTKSSSWASQYMFLGRHSLASTSTKSPSLSSKFPASITPIKHPAHRVKHQAARAPCKLQSKKVQSLRPALQRIGSPRASKRSSMSVTARSCFSGDRRGHARLASPGRRSTRGCSITHLFTVGCRGIGSAGGRSRLNPRVPHRPPGPTQRH